MNKQDKKEYVIISNNDTLEKYKEYYFKKYPRRTKFPIKEPCHPSINTWFILQRPSMNKLKQDWKEYIIWLVDKHGLTNKRIEKCKLTYIYHRPTKRRADCDNLTPKFTNDGLVEAGVVIDDSYFCCNPLVIYLDYDKDNPSMEIHIEVIED